MSTPNLDALVSKSLFLRKAQVQQAVCSPTRTSLLTSRYPDTTRVWDLYSYFRDVGGNYTTIPELFKLNGYKTIGAGKIFHPGHASGGQHPDAKNQKGDDTPYSWTEPYYHSPDGSHWDSSQHSYLAVPPQDEKQIPLPDTQIADSAIQTLESLALQGVGTNLEAEEGQPFFLAVGFHKPHLPFVAPVKFFDLYPFDEIELPQDQDAPKDMPRVAWSDWGELRNYQDIAALNNSGVPGDKLPVNVTKALRRAYYAAVSYMDDQLGRVVAALDQHGFSNNTVISFWGDHGWQLGEHGEWCKHTNFDLATNAPMMVHIPGQTDHGITTSTPTEFIDLMPTLAAAAMPGVTVPACPEDAEAARKVQLCTHGVSLLPLIDAPDSPVKPAAYSQYPRGYQRPEQVGQPMHDIVSDNGPSACLSKHCTMGYSMLTSVEGVEYRYTEWVDFNTVHANAPDWDRVVGTELYNHNADPLENVNIAPEADKALLAQLSALLRKHPVAGVAARQEL